jgi:hypothetical protein
MDCKWCDAYEQAANAGKSDAEAIELANAAVVANGGQH